jgi:DNA-binding CsgD family transcriptional regulator
MLAFESLLTALASAASIVSGRSEGAGFLRALKTLYPLATVSYCCVNVHDNARNQYAHCIFSDAAVAHYVSQSRVSVVESTADSDTECQSPLDLSRYLTFWQRARVGETAAFRVGLPDDTQIEAAEALARDVEVLATYFHGHVLRIFGKDSTDHLLVSARELDCLKWTAAGKTAWEASVILGISERTVRFHLNAAREKLNCTTTTQAVAKAVAHKLIDPSMTG